jgi:hypothetical protein
MDAVLAELAVAQRDSGICMSRDLECSRHLPSYSRRNDKDDKVALLSWTSKSRA